MNERKVPPVSENFFSEEELKLLKAPYTKEELEKSKKCTFNSCLKFGLPLALISQVCLTFTKSGVPVTSLGRGVNFAGCMLFSVILFKPLCSCLIRANRIVLHRKKKEELGQLLGGTEDPQPVYQQDDLGYPSDLMTNLDSTESFSADFSSSSLDLEDLGDGPKPRGVTYEELRARHRGKLSQPDSKPSNVYSEPGKPATLLVVRKTEPENPRPRKLNKYGDEFE